VPSRARNRLRGHARARGDVRTAARAARLRDVVSVEMLRSREMIFARVAAVLVCVGFVLAVSCGGDPGIGASCMADKECGARRCLCIRGGGDGGGTGSIPGVCSVTCNSGADCAKLGSNMSCAKDFCTGVNLCLQNYS